jgi:hypothetical protein
MGRKNARALRNQQKSPGRSFQGDNRDKLEVFRANRQAIELNSAAAIS